jgi:oxygen-independent coproporphyrinogen-3 oxidase
MSHLLSTSNLDTNTLAIYVHIPFCAKHCAYCDFNTYVERSQSQLVLKTVGAICRDIEQTAVALPTFQRERPITSIFFGGGTPTFLQGTQLAKILETIRSCFKVTPTAEISSEANPTSSDAEKFAQMREAGFNRLSIGVQAFDDTLLVALDRFHTAGEAERALQSAREAGFQNINLDLMFGLPKQTLSLWEASLQRALEQEITHLSLYALTLEPGTRFERLHAGGKLSLPGEEAEIAMYTHSRKALAQAGMEHYEVSNFARSGFRCQHNLVYWHNEEYLGFGAGAVSYLEGKRWKRERQPRAYIEKVTTGQDLAVEAETLSKEEVLGETMMLGLRLRGGLALQRVRDRFGVEPLEHFAEPIRTLKRRGWLVLENDTLSLTEEGLLLANEALCEFVG